MNNSLPRPAARPDFLLRHTAIIDLLFRRTTIITALTLFTITLYYQVYEFQFVFDDKIFFKIWPLFFSNFSVVNDNDWLYFIFQEKVLDSYYRPLPIVFYLLSLKASAAEPWLPHLNNLVLYIFTTVLIFLTAVRLLAGYSLPRTINFLAATISAILFSVNPLHVEPVAWISGMFDLWCTFFLSIILFLDLAPKRSILTILVIWATFLAALFSKETAVILIGVYPLWRLAVTTDEKNNIPQILFSRTNLIIFCGLVLTFFIYLLIRYQFTGDIFVFSLRENNFSFPVQSWLGLFSVSLIEHLRGLLIPISWLGLQRSLNIDSLSLFDLRVISGFAAVIFLGFLLIYLSKKKRRAFLFLALILISITPTINLVINSISPGLYYANRFLYFPSVILALGLSVLLATIIKRFSGSTARTAIALIIIFLSGIQIYFTAKILPEWRNNIELYDWANRYDPYEKTFLFAAVTRQLRRGDYNAAIQQCQINFARLPQNRKFVNNDILLLQACAKLFYDLGQDQAAYQLANQFDDPQMHLFLADLHLNARRIPETISEAQKVLRLSPDNQTAYMYLALVALLQKDCTAADAHFKKILDLYPRYIEIKQKWQITAPQKNPWEIYQTFLRDQKVAPELIETAHGCGN